MMVKNKNIGGRPKRSSTCKTKKAGSKIACNTDVTPLDNPADSDIPAISPELQTTGQGQLGFPDRVYLLASVIFQNNHLEKPAAQRLVNYGKEGGLPLPEVKDEEMQRTAYELAFNTLKCEWRVEWLDLLNPLSLLFFLPSFPFLSTLHVCIYPHNSYTYIVVLGGFRVRTSAKGVRYPLF